MDIHISGCLLLQNNSGQQKSAEFYLLCSALLCSALLCSAVSILRRESCCQVLFHGAALFFRPSETKAQTTLALWWNFY